GGDWQPGVHVQSLFGSVFSPSLGLLGFSFGSFSSRGLSGMNPARGLRYSPGGSPGRLVPPLGLAQPTSISKLGVPFGPWLSPPVAVVEQVSLSEMSPLRSVQEMGLFRPYAYRFVPTPGSAGDTGSGERNRPQAGS